MDGHLNLIADPAFGFGKLRRVCEILGLQVDAMSSYPVLKDSKCGGRSFIANTDLGDLWYFPQSNELIFFVFDFDEAELKNLVFLTADHLELALPKVKITIDIFRI